MSTDSYLRSKITSTLTRKWFAARSRIARREQSERQWSDVSGVIKVQGERLDRSYLRHWAKHLKVSDLLERALR
jgi:hypothetical protein